MKRWIVPKVSKDLIKELAEQCDVSEFLALIAAARGYTDPLELDAFLSCDEPLDSPYSLTDMDNAVLAIRSALEENKLIAIYGDYDCDGVTATALLYTYLKSIGANVICYIPSRADEGYGMNCESVEKLDGKGVGLIITVDNGINANEEIALANSLGIGVVVTDHHMPAGELPAALAVVDPHREDDHSEFKDLSGVGVAYKLICALENATPEELLPMYADLVALGTVADVMPLRNENRVIVREGLMYINNTARIGLSALIEVSGLNDKELGAGNLAFNIGPRINAAGRMGDAMRAVKLLCAEDYESALQIAKEISEENATRQKIEADIEKEAISLIEREKLFYDRVIVVAGKGWHKGIVGIAASRLVEKYGKPVIVLSIEDGVAVGSGRSVDGFSLFDAICSAEELLEKFGGHELAAGLTVLEENIPAVRERINAFAYKKPLAVPQIELDCKLNPAALSVEMGELVGTLAPFGKGNPNPLFGIYSLEIERINQIGGGKHLRLILTREKSVIQALMFNKTLETFPYEVGDKVDIAVTLDTGEYKGEKNLTVIIREIRPSDESEADIESAADFCAFMAGAKKRNLSSIIPTRDEIGTVYRCITDAISADLLENKLTGRLLRGKVKIALEVLEELSLIRKIITVNGKKYQRIEGARSDLDNSIILKTLKEGETE